MVKKIGKVDLVNRLYADMGGATGNVTKTAITKVITQLDETVLALLNENPEMGVLLGGMGHFRVVEVGERRFTKPDGSTMQIAKHNRVAFRTSTSMNKGVEGAKA